MANKKISAFTELTEAPATGDVLPIVDVSDTTGAPTGTTKKVSLTNLSAGIVDISTSQLDAASLVTESEGISSNDNDTTLPTSAAVKDYVDTQILTKDNLDEIAEGTTNKHFTATDETKLDGIESSADVTDTANVTAAGALMDSELTDLAGVKGVTISTLQEKPSEGAFVDGDKTKLDGIATAATANDTDANLKNRANHTGTQAASTITSFATEVANTSAVTANTAKVTNATHTGDVTGSTALTIADAAVTEAKIANSAITTNKISPDCIFAGQLGADSVGTEELQDNVVGTASIQSDAVQTAKIADDAVTGAKLNAALNDLSNVDAGSPSDTQVLKWNSTSSKWEAADDGGGGGGGGSGDITRVNITAGTGLSGTQDTTTGDHTQTLAVDVGIADDKIAQVDGTPADNEYARWTSNGLEGRAAADVLTDIGASASDHNHDSSYVSKSAPIATAGLYEHAHTISADYTIATGNNAFSAGPVTVDDGYSVTVPSGSTWVVA